jgi:2-desacetyl-2-hydroxyethyl bacteriochlorophyllide A dehydrogenase
MAPGSTSEALVCTPGQVQAKRLGLRSLGPRDVLVRTSVSGVSTGTDRWVMQGSFVWVDISYPAVPGYQLAGVVESVGGEVEDFVVGQPAVVTGAKDYVEVSSAWGTHASAVVAEVDDVHDARMLPPLRAAFVVVAQVGYNAASRLHLPAGERVVVVGDGVIGACAALACRARGFDVLVAGRHDARLGPIAQLGLATVNVRGSNGDAVRDFAPAGVIDTVQNSAAFEMYSPVLPRRTGELVYSGHSPGGITAWADMAVLQKREWTVHFVSGKTRQRLEATLDLMRQGHLPCERLVGATADGRTVAEALMTDVAKGGLVPVAAAIDWGWAG